MKQGWLEGTILNAVPTTGYYRCCILVLCAVTPIWTCHVAAATHSVQNRSGLRALLETHKGWHTLLLDKFVP
jgi:hypothetical protein